MNNPSQPSAVRTTTPFAIVGRIAAWLALTIYFLLPPREAMSWGLDSSNYGSYAWMIVTGRQFGADTVAMTGPFGFLAYGHTYSGYGFFAYAIGDLLFKAGFAVLTLQHHCAGKRYLPVAVQVFHLVLHHHHILLFRA